MRIYGGHDYYDSALSMGIDPTITLVRGKSRSIDAEDAGGSLLKRKLVIKPQYSPVIGIKCVAVVFCGKVFRGVLGLRPLERAEGIWSAEKARAFASTVKKTRIEVETRWDRRDKMTLEEWFTPYETSGDLREYMIANRISILVEEEAVRGEEPIFARNPFTLKQLGFAKALDPYTAFQELSMWIGGILGGESPKIVTIKDDKVLVESHGFDNRFSFRGPRIA